MNEYGVLMEWRRQGNWSTLRKTCPSVTVSTLNLTWSGLGDRPVYKELLFQLLTWYDSETQAFRLSSRRLTALGHQALDTATPSAHQLVPWTQPVQLAGSLAVLKQRHRAAFLQRRWELRELKFLQHCCWGFNLSGMWCCHCVCGSWHFIVSWCLHL
jgi:hypothetical protein